MSFKLSQKPRIRRQSCILLKSHIKISGIGAETWHTVCKRHHCAVSEMETVHTESTSVTCTVYTSSIMWAMVHRSSAELCQGGLSQQFCFCWNAEGDQVGQSQFISLPWKWPDAHLWWVAKAELRPDWWRSVGCIRHEGRNVLLQSTIECSQEQAGMC